MNTKTVIVNFFKEYCSLSDSSEEEILNFKIFLDSGFA